MKLLNEKYEMILLGNMKFTKNNSRYGSNYPFSNLSNGAPFRVEQGWIRTEEKVVKGSRDRILYVAQATACKEKKQVYIMNNHIV